MTIIGKNVLINSLLNSTFLFNAQIEFPPKDFLKLVDHLNKDFLWRGAAHGAIIFDGSESYWRSDVSGTSRIVYGAVS